MPSPVDVEYLDGVFIVSETEPSTVQEVVDLLGEEAVRKGAINDNRYRNKYPRVYKKVSEALVSQHSFPRAVVKEETKKDGTIKKTMESTNDHCRAALDGRKTKSDAGEEVVTPSGVTKETLAELFSTIGPAEPLYVKGERAGGSGKVSQASLDGANGFFAEGPDRVEEIITTIETMVPGYKVGRDADNDATPESLARGIQALEKKLLVDSKAVAKAALAKK